MHEITCTTIADERCRPANLAGLSEFFADLFHHPRVNRNSRVHDTLSLSIVSVDQAPAVQPISIMDKLADGDDPAWEIPPPEHAFPRNAA